MLRNCGVRHSTTAQWLTINFSDTECIIWPFGFLFPKRSKIDILNSQTQENKITALE